MVIVGRKDVATPRGPRREKTKPATPEAPTTAPSVGDAFQRGAGASKAKPPDALLHEFAGNCATVRAAASSADKTGYVIAIGNAAAVVGSATSTSLGGALGADISLKGALLDVAAAQKDAERALALLQNIVVDAERSGFAINHERMDAVTATLNNICLGIDPYVAAFEQAAKSAEGAVRLERRFDMGVLARAVAGLLSGEADVLDGALAMLRDALIAADRKPT